MSTLATTSRAGLAYEIHGTGEPVLFVNPAATRAQVWLGHQAPAVTGAGYQAVVFDSRGMAPSVVPPGPYRISDLVADTADLIRELRLGPCRVVGASLGAMVAQELALAHPELVRGVVLLGTRGRTDFFRKALARASAARMRDPGPVTDHDALAHMATLFGERTLGDDRVADDWFTLLRRFPIKGPGPAAQYEATVIANRLAALGDVSRPCLVVAFGDDLLTPPAFCREVADAIPGSGYVELPGLGHFGFVEDPATVNALILGFLNDV